MTLIHGAGFIPAIVPNLLTGTARDCYLPGNYGLWIHQLLNPHIANHLLEPFLVKTSSRHFHRLDDFVQVFPGSATEHTVPPVEVFDSELHARPNVVADDVHIWLIAKFLFELAFGEVPEIGFGSSVERICSFLIRLHVAKIPDV